MLGDLMFKGFLVGLSIKPLDTAMFQLSLDVTQ
jgi:hypothetical protein